QKDSLKDGLDEAMTGCMGEAGGSVSQSYEKAMDELDDWEFEFDGGEDAESRERYLQYLMDNIDAIFAWAEMEIAKTEQATIAENLITDTYYELLYSGMYDEDALTREFEDIMQYLDALYCEAIEDVEDVYTAYIEKSIRDLTNLDILPGSTLESSDDGVEGTIYIEGTVGGMTELVITRDLINTSLDDKIADGTLVPADEAFDADLESLVDGKKVLGVYTVKLWNEAEGGELSLFEGSYTITIKLSSLLKDADGLQILYVGDDGRIEVYETTISEDGEWISFTTTHLSQFVVVGSEEKDMSTMIIFLEVLLWIEAAIALALLIVFLVRRFRGGTPGRKAKRVASFGAMALLLGVFPAASTLNIVLFAVADVAMIAVIMLLVYALMSQKKKNEPVEEADEGADSDANNKKDK
ncbi:MAG: hypothetical protein LUD29_06030, partial [Clostridia bacterium]|nr:hypothetical protein [Clostridia bacterium]